MTDRPGLLARYRLRSLLAVAALAAAALTLALAGAFGAVAPAIAVDGCLALALLGALAYAAIQSGIVARISETSYLAAQIVGAFLLLAWLTVRAGDTPLPIAFLYLFTMLYAAFLLDRQRLIVLGAIGLVMHGTTLFLLIDRGGKISLPAAWLQIVALLIAFAWLVYAAGFIHRLRGRLAAARSRLHDLEREANERAGRDVLTGIVHERHLMDALDREIARAERIQKPLSIARVDLDWLGSLNEKHGRIAGDVALRRFTVAAMEALRDVDVLGRYGGKEFLAIMPDTALKGAVIAAERLRASVGREPVPDVDGRRRLSCTLGVAEHRQGENTRLFIARAEAGLAYAKAAGRDRVVALGTDGKPSIIEAA